jgi:hypothetical protein
LNYFSRQSFDNDNASAEAKRREEVKNAKLQAEAKQQAPIEQKAQGTAETETGITFLDLARLTCMGLETCRRLQSLSAGMPGKILTRFLPV